MLGRPLCNALRSQHDLIETKRIDLDVTDSDALRACILNSRPQWVIHLAALTDVDRCART